MRSVSDATSVPQASSALAVAPGASDGERLEEPLAGALA
jgi:hypothetical protein